MLVKLHPHRHTSTKGVQAITGKLAKRYYGPFCIQERVDTMAYRLQLPEEAQIHPVFHYSLLKPFHGSLKGIEATALPPHFANNQPLICPLAILDYRRASPTDPWEVLVQWQGLAPDKTSWEDWSQLCSDYHLEDKVSLQGPRDNNRDNSHKIKNRGATNRKAQKKTHQTSIPQRLCVRKWTKLPAPEDLAWMVLSILRGDALTNLA